MTLDEKVYHYCMLRGWGHKFASEQAYRVRTEQDNPWLKELADIFKGIK